MKGIKFPVIAATAYLLVYTCLGYFGAPSGLIFVLFALSPVVVTWMVIRILKNGTYTGGPLKGEWGYEDYDPAQKD